MLPLQQIGVSLEIVSDLGGQAADVDGVGGGQPAAVAAGQAAVFSRSEDILYAGLGIVEIAHHGANRHIFTLLGDHLCPLNLGHTAIGIKYADLHTLHIRKTSQRCLAGIAGCSGKDRDIIGHSLDPSCTG